MNRADIVEKKEKSIFELIFIVLIICILMATFINYFMSQERQIVDAGFETLAQRFSSTVNVVHGQWMMDGQPDFVALKGYATQEVQTVLVNKKGWIDSKNIDLPCHHIWQQVMVMPMQFLQEPISAIEVKNTVTINLRHCRFSLPSGQYFEYQASSGKVKRGDE